MSKPPTLQFGGMDDDDGYYYTGQTPFRKPDESKLRFHARRLISIQTLARLEYNAEVAETKFNRSLGPIELTLVGLGTAARTQAGPAVTISFILGGVVSGIAALSYAEMASMIPISGSAYTYAYATLGELAAWIISWNLILEYMVGAATVSIGWSSYFVAFVKDAFDYELSDEWTKAPIKWTSDVFELTEDYFNAPAFCIVLIVTFTIYFGIHLTAKINNVLVMFKILVLIIMIFALIPFIKTENYHPYIVPKDINSGQFGPTGILQGTSTVFFAYIGFDSISTTAQEAREPQVSLPIGILSTLGISAVIYISLSAVIMGVHNYADLHDRYPLVSVVRTTNMKWLMVLTDVGALAATTSVILVLLIAQPRVFYSMSNDGLIPRFFSKIHPKHKIPHLGTLFTGIVCAICGGLLPIEVLSDMASLGTILTFFVVNIGVIILRYTRKTVPRRFKVPGGIGAASSILLIQGAKREVIIRLLVWVGIGIVIYLFYGRRHSEVNNPRLVQNDPMRVLHENFSVDTVNYRGFNDEHLRRQYERQLGRRLGGGVSSGRVSERSCGGESGVVDDGQEYLPGGVSGTGTPRSRGSSLGKQSPPVAGPGGQEMTEIEIDRLDGTGARGNGNGADHIYQQRLQQLQHIQQQQQTTSDESDGSGVGGSGTGSGSGSWSRSRSKLLQLPYAARSSTVDRTRSENTKEDGELNYGGVENEMERKGQQSLDTLYSSSPSLPPPGGH
ncbi:Cationic amino acid transporter-1 [Haplosporangium gracile]|nr:Cationic amino acid transporter-1 [Haplosporangium gracile]